MPNILNRGDKEKERIETNRPIHQSDIVPGIIKTRHLRLTEGLPLLERSSDPPDPGEGNSVIWQSDGNGTTGDSGDICVAITAGGTTKKKILVDYSAI